MVAPVLEGFLKRWNFSPIGLESCSLGRLGGGWFALGLKYISNFSLWTLLLKETLIDFISNAK